MGGDSGRAIESDAVSTRVDQLGEAVSERENFSKSLKEILTDVPAEINSKGIDDYIQKLNDLIGKTNNEKTKVLLE